MMNNLNNFKPILLMTALLGVSGGFRDSRGDWSGRRPLPIAYDSVAGLEFRETVFHEALRFFFPAERC